MKVLFFAAYALTLTACGSFDPNASFDNRSFDRLEVSFDESAVEFDAAAELMRDQLADVPDIEWASWSFTRWCVTRLNQPQECRDVSPEEEAVFNPLPNPAVIRYQAKDGDRIFFRFNVNDPPQYHVMHQGERLEQSDFVADRGFRSSRELGDGWTILGPIPEEEDFFEQWLTP